jgi:hypothetical protein
MEELRGEDWKNVEETCLGGKFGRRAVSSKGVLPPPPALAAATLLQRLARAIGERIKENAKVPVLLVVVVVVVRTKVPAIFIDVDTKTRSGRSWRRCQSSFIVSHQRGSEDRPRCSRRSLLL